MATPTTNPLKTITLTPLEKGRGKGGGKGGKQAPVQAYKKGTFKVGKGKKAC